MGLKPGDRLSIYEVVGPLGAGAMGEVYRARDSRLEREVAIKLLPDDFAADPERLARFEREARLLASVQHPHIGGIHGIEEVDGTRFLVLELIEGQTLGDRIAAGPIPLDEVVALARQIAEGLEAAHECGVVHRDLKPDNIRVTPDDTVKLLDFGLAKSVAGPGSVDMTQSGVLLGTPHYMSPEQVRGRPVDRRADIWAFGCVLYEMLTGSVRAFPGETMAEVAVAVLEREPDLDALPAGSVRALIADCLVKDPRDRLRDIGDARRALSRPRESTLEAAAAPLATSRWPLALVLAAIVIGAGVLLRPTAQTEQAGQVVRFAYAVPETATAVRRVAIAPDGRTLAVIGMDVEEREPYVWIHRLDSADERWTRLEHSRGATVARFAPDSQWMIVDCHEGYADMSVIKKVPVNRSPPEAMWEVDNSSYDYAWDESGSLWRLDAASLEKVSATGEVATTVKLEIKSPMDYWYRLEISAGLALVTGEVQNREGKIEEVTRAISLSGSPEPIALPGSAKLLRSGRLLYAEGGTLLVQRFDVDGLARHGDATAIVEHLWRDKSHRAGRYALAAQTGTLAYARRRSPTHLERRLVEIDPETKEVTEVASGEYHGMLAASHDGRVVVVPAWHKNRLVPRVSTDGAERGGDARFRALHWNVCLSHDAKTLFGTDTRAGSNGIYRVGLNDRTAPQPLVPAEEDEILTVLDASEDQLVFSRWRMQDGARHALFALKLGEPGAKPKPFFSGDFWIGFDGSFSPDGSRFAYSTDETGEDEVYVMEDGSSDKASKYGGSKPSWSADGKRIYYVDNKLWLVAVDAETPGEPAPLLDLGSTEIRWVSNWWSRIVPLDNGRFLLIQQSQAEYEGPREVHVILNFPQLLPDD